MGNGFFYRLALVAGFAARLATAECLSHQIKFQQTNDQYHWSLSWKSKKNFAQQITQFTSESGDALEGRSEVVQSMRWRPIGTSQGDIEAWVLVDMGISTSRKYFVRHCQLGNALNCQLDTNLGDGGSQINWMSSVLTCTANGAEHRCQYDESGSIKGFGFFVSPQKMSVGVNIQTMKDVLRLAIASEHGTAGISTGFQTSRSGLDGFWNQSQQKLSRKERSFSVESSLECR